MSTGGELILGMFVKPRWALKIFAEPNVDFLDQLIIVIESVLAPIELD
jgi:hypothetical protein